MPERIVAFLRYIGLVVEERNLSDDTVLPGVSIDHGRLVVDAGRLRHPGDLLHEAGHLAVVPAAERERLAADAGDDGGMEMAAIAWSYAAAVHLGLPPEVVFHDDGYRGGAAALRENFSQGRTIGVPILVWRGMARAPARGQPAEAGHYPAMLKWLCD